MRIFLTQQGIVVAVLLAIVVAADGRTVRSEEEASSSNAPSSAKRSAFGLPVALRSRVFNNRPAPEWLRRISGFTSPQSESRASTPESSQASLTKAQPSTHTQTADNRVDGTWKEENGYVIINLNGQELRLAKSADTAAVKPVDPRPPRHDQTIVPAAFSTASEEGVISLNAATPAVAGGTVNGRLMHRGRPVAECRVSLIPLTKSFGGYQIDDRAEPQSSLTAADGRYRFEHVPRGAYKLFWLPKGEQSWIRRIEYKPDVVVRTGEVSRIKEIRTSLRTLN